MTALRGGGATATTPGRLPAHHTPVKGLSFCGGPLGFALSAPAVGGALALLGGLAAARVRRDG